MFITQKSLPRRTILRGVGTALALPLLDAMVPALRAERLTAAAPVRRLGFVMYPLGVDQDRWRPKGEGADYEFSEALAPLAPHRKKFVVISGLSSDPGQVQAGLSRSCARVIHDGRGADQRQDPRRYLYRPVGCADAGKRNAVRFPGTCWEKTTTGSAHVGPLFKSATVPLPLEYNPRRVFEQLFGEGGRIDPAATAARQAADRSSLDTVTERIAQLKKQLTAADRHKLDEYRGIHPRYRAQDSGRYAQAT